MDVYAFYMLRIPQYVRGRMEIKDIKLRRDRKKCAFFYLAWVVINASHGWRLRSSCCDGMWNFQRQTHCIIGTQRESATRLAIKQTNCRSHGGFVFRIRIIHRLRYHAYNLLLFHHFIAALAQYFYHRKIIAHWNFRCRKWKAEILIAFK